MSVEALARLTDAAGVMDTLYYSVDNGPEAPLGSGEAQGENPITLEGTIDLSGRADGEHQLRFWIVNSKGASSEAIAKTVVIEGGKIMEIEDYIEEVPGPAEQWGEYRRYGSAFPRSAMSGFVTAEKSNMPVCWFRRIWLATGGRKRLLSKNRWTLPPVSASSATIRMASLSRACPQRREPIPPPSLCGIAA